MKVLFMKKRVSQFLFWISGHVEKRLDKKARVNFKIYDVTKNNYNTYIPRYIKDVIPSDNEIVPDFFFKNQN